MVVFKKLESTHYFWLEERWKERKEGEGKSRESKGFPLVCWREIERRKENVGTGFLLGQLFFSPSKL